MKKIIACLLISLFYYSLSWAAPSISGHSGTKTPGTEQTLTGSGFGAYTAASTEWLGPNCVEKAAGKCIETGTAETRFSRTGWTTDSTLENVSINPVYTTDDAHSGSQSILSVIDSTTYRSATLFDIGSVPNTTLVSSWVKLTTSITWNGQWKIFGLDNSTVWHDNYLIAYESQFYKNDGSSCQQFNIYFNGAGTMQAADPGQMIVPKDTWTRVDQYVKKSTDGSTADGAYKIWVWKGGTRVLLRSVENVTTRQDGRYPYWPAYIGNTNQCDAGGTRNANIYVDDHGISWGNGLAMVNLCDGATLDASTHCEMQGIITSWGAEEIKFPLNIGSFSSSAGSLRFIVSDSDGNEAASAAFDLGGAPSITYEAGLDLGPKCSADSIIKSIASGSTGTFALTADSGYYIKISGTCGGSLSATFAESATYTTGTMSGNCIQDVECPIMPGVPFSK